MIRKNIVKDLENVSDKDKVPGLLRFFKTGKGQYGYGDRFVGIKTPDLAKIIKRYYKDISFDELEFFVTNPIHEYRVFGFMCLVHKYEAKTADKESIFKYFKRYIKYLNNWDLVDITVPHVIGEYLFDRDKDWLYNLARSKNLWYRRISVISTFEFIRRGKYDDTLKISEILLDDKEDLIHKAVGWMLREVGKRNLDIEESFLKKHYKVMPRTMLRYALEKFDEPKRQMYLSGKV
ncbi:MAG: DNA alkylation repair protein [Candidatus Dojkabacteria bacterium]|nr:DNA alkylation repair protein [Candidatus Dojkabacteria bacterium]